MTPVTAKHVKRVTARIKEQLDGLTGAVVKKSYITEVLYGAEVFQPVYKAIICQSLQADLERHPVGEISIKRCEAALLF